MANTIIKRTSTKVIMKVPSRLRAKSLWRSRTQFVSEKDAKLPWSII
jgi:hypothetical protein